MNKEGYGNEQLTAEWVFCRHFFQRNTFEEFRDDRSVCQATLETDQEMMMGLFSEMISKLFYMCHIWALHTVIKL